MGVRREVRSLIRGLKRQVTVHQMAVKRSKEGRLISKHTLIRCRELAKATIPRIFDQLERDYSQKTQFLLYGYLTAYLVSIYGHRCGVYQNLTIKEVEEAVHSGEVFLINVNRHKTNQAFGPAQLALVKEEYGWFQRLLNIKEKLMAWKEMGLMGTPTFTDLRSAIATQAKNSHGVDARLNEVFYEVNLTALRQWITATFLRWHWRDRTPLQTRWSIKRERRWTKRIVLQSANAALPATPRVLGAPVRKRRSLFTRSLACRPKTRMRGVSIMSCSYGVLSLWHLKTF
ncbi:uncharacterized protein [Misgurnus anguillicaudatus]|uniref:uncharacterized protein n=1 Tax=Misgurnus anguillicaudatus TaxID=75329 RepID=UPI003CCF8257